MIQDIIIPTCKTEMELAPFMADIGGFSLGTNIITTCKKASASVNRNAGMELSESPITIMVDDDVTGFWEGWWQSLVLPLATDPEVIMVSARLISADGSIGAMMYGSGNMEYSREEVKLVPTAVCAFRKTDLRFDENMIKAGWEDTLFGQELKLRHPKGKIIINNRCKMVHKNEQKFQGEAFEHNKKHYHKRCDELGIAKGDR